MATKSTSPRRDGEERAAGGVVFLEGDDGRQYLILRHRDGGHWGFPKGRIEFGESTVDAALREIREETGISALSLIPEFSSTSRYCVTRGTRTLEKTVDYFLARTRDDAVHLSDEHDAARWLSVDRAREALTHEENRRILDEADAFLDRTGPGGD